MSTYLLKMDNIRKSFSGIAALHDAAFELKSGEVHALLGANGAGKSTLMKILSGVYGHDSGEIELEGKPITIHSPKIAKELGIYCVYQEVDTAIVPQLSVAENILLDSFSRAKGLFISYKKLYQKAKEVLQLVNGGTFSVYKQATELTLAEKQMVLIARALVHSAKVIIFDEPTAPLSIDETHLFYTVIERLKAQGIGCVFISHRLPEVFDISDRITVMRDGKTIATYETSMVNQQTIVETMLGKICTNEVVDRIYTVGEPVLEISNVTDGGKLKNISFSVSEGEIVGIVGLVGAGKTELAKALFGYSSLKSGQLFISQKPYRFKRPSDAIRAGMALIPEERRKEGLFVQNSVRENLTLPNLQKFSHLFLMSKKLEKQHSQNMIEMLGIKTNNSESPLVHLSGGNQQKVAIGKWLSRDATIYLFDEPTKGVDIGAKEDIFKLINQLSAEGKGILYFSCEINEVIGIADRVLVMYDGMIVKELSKEEMTQDKILLYASGGREEENDEGETYQHYI